MFVSKKQKNVVVLLGGSWGSEFDAGSQNIQWIYFWMDANRSISARYVSDHFKGYSCL